MIDKRSEALVKYQRERREQGVQKVVAFYREHPFSTAKECANALGMSYDTVTRYVRILRDRSREDMKV